MTTRFVKPTPEEVTVYAKSIGFNLDGERFYDYYESKGWMIGKSPMKNWQAAVRTWKRNDKVSTPMKRDEEPICLVDRRASSKYALARNGEKMYLCDDCCKFFKLSHPQGSWNGMTKGEIEAWVLKGKAQHDATTEN